jgi:hypothetical protein
MAIAHEAENAIQNRAPLSGGVKGKTVKPQRVKTQTAYRY